MDALKKYALSFLGGALCVFYSFVAILILFEWFKIGVVADPQEIGKYYFGSEAMVGHGGWKYKSSENYALSAFYEGIVFTLLASWAGWALIKTKKKHIIACLTVLPISYLILWV